MRHHRVGGGRELYTQLLRWLTERGYRQAFAGITMEHDCWHYVARMQLDLLDTADPDEPPGPMG